MPQWALVAGIDKPLISTYSRIRPCMSSSMFASVCVLVCVCVSHCIRVHVCECVYVCATGYLCIVARLYVPAVRPRVCVCVLGCVSACTCIYALVLRLRGCLDVFVCLYTVGVSFCLSAYVCALAIHVCEEGMGLVDRWNETE